MSSSNSKRRAAAPGRVVSAARRSRERIKSGVSRYRDVRKSLRTPSSSRSRNGLDWLNFFIADIQTGFGTFVAFYLAHLEWPQGTIGAALSVGALAGVLSQIPGGALADAVRWKRALVAIGIVMVAGAAAIFAFLPDFAMVFVAEILHGTTAGIITPAIGAISLGLVGQRGMSLRTGRNFRFAAAGSALTAAVLGVAGTYLEVNAIFIVVAAFAIPALIALACIRPDEINYARARNAGVGEQTAELLRLRELARSRGLLLFMACVVLFQFADASMLPLVSEEIAKEGGLSAAALSGLIIVPQIVVAALAPWVGYHSETKGRRPLLLIGFALEPVRAVLLAITTNYGVLMVAQLLNGITSAILTVLTVLVVSDLTAGTGRFNLARGAIGAAIGVAVSVSTASTGVIVQHWGREAGFLAIAAVAMGATALLWVFQSETKPQQYQD